VRHNSHVPGMPRELPLGFRAMGSGAPTEEPKQAGEGPPPAGGDTLDSDDQAPENVGENINRRGEDRADKEGGETGRVDHG
jgi:hypothetical protein